MSLEESHTSLLCGSARASHFPDDFVSFAKKLGPHPRHGRARAHRRAGAPDDPPLGSGPAVGHGSRPTTTSASCSAASRRCTPRSAGFLRRSLRPGCSCRRPRSNAASPPPDAAVGSRPAHQRRAHSSRSTPFVLLRREISVTHWINKPSHVSSHSTSQYGLQSLLCESDQQR